MNKQMSGAIIVAVAGMGGCLVILLLAGLLWMMKKKTTPGSPPTGSPPGSTSTSTVTESLTSFTTGQKVTISKDGKMIGFKLKPEDKDNVCDIMYPAESGTFLLDKVGSKGYSMTVNCNGDDSWLSFMADSATDMVQPVRNLKGPNGKGPKPAWVIACPSAAQGCSIQAVKSRKYISPTTEGTFGVTLTSTPTYWMFGNSSG